MGKKTPFYRWGKNPIVICPARSEAVLPLLGVVLSLKRKFQEKHGRHVKRRSGSAIEAVLSSIPRRYYRLGKGGNQKQARKEFPKRY